MAEPGLHLDADTSIRQLQRALLEQGHDVSRTPNAWRALDANDEAQLLGATTQGRVIFTFNVRDHVALADRYPRHGGIVLAAQRQWTLGVLIRALDRMLTETTADEWPSQIRWLTLWKSA